MQKLNLKTILKNNLINAERIAVLGIGSELKADDIAGMEIAKYIDTVCSKNDSKCCDFKIFYGGTAPENFTGEIKKYKPSHLIIIDAADTGNEPGTIVFIKPEELAGISFSTHMLPIKIMIDYMLQSFECKVIVLGIQPKNLEFGDKCSKEVKTSIKQVGKAVSSIICN